MRAVAWVVAIAWIALALALAGRGAIVAAREGKVGAAVARLKSPTVYLFAGYLVVAGLVSPRSPGETSSPLFGLAAVLLAFWAAASFAATATPRSPRAFAAVLFGVFGGAVLAAGAIVLALASPAFVPPWLR